MPSLFIFDPDGPHIEFQAIDKTIEQLLLKFPEFVLSQLGRPDSHNGIGRLTGASTSQGRNLLSPDST